MGGLRLRMPVTFWTFVIGSAALSGFPLITAGFYSKEWILSSVWAAPNGGWLWCGGLVGALITGLYSFRLIFRVFFGDLRTAPGHGPGVAMTVPLLVLAAASLGIGFLEMPPGLGHVTVFSRYLNHYATLPQTIPDASGHTDILAQMAVSIASVTGIALAAWWFLPRRGAKHLSPREGSLSALTELLLRGWGFDALYDRLFVRPWHVMTRSSADGIDRLYGSLEEGAQALHAALSRTQTGLVRWYAASLGMGAALLVGWFAL